MKHRAVFFDRDNTLIANDGYLGDPDRVILIHGADEAVARAKRLGYLVVTVSNQSGVARGMFDEAAVRAVNDRMDQILRSLNPAAAIDRHEYCPFHPEALVLEYRQESELRKPRPGMLFKAAEELGIDLSESWLVGDAPRDVAAGRAAGCRTILFVDPSLPASPAAGEAGAEADFRVTSLRQALDVIERHTAVGERPGATEAAAPDAAAAPAGMATDRLEVLATQILQELKRRNEREHSDFSVSRLMAGIVQVVVFAVLFLAYLNHRDAAALQGLLLLAIALQSLVSSLVLMARKG